MYVLTQATLTQAFGSIQPSMHEGMSELDFHSFPARNLIWMRHKKLFFPLRCVCVCVCRRPRSVSG